MGRPTNRSSPRAFAIDSDENDSSDASKSANFSCRQNISDGCNAVGIRSMPSGFTVPSKMGRVRGFKVMAMLSWSFMRCPYSPALRVGPRRRVTRKTAATRDSAAGASFDFDSRLFDHPAPCLDFFFHLLEESFRCSGRGRDTLPSQFLFHITLPHDPYDVFIDALDQRPGKPPRADETMPVIDVVPADAGLGERRYAAFGRDALYARHGDSAQTPGLHVRQRRGNTAE